MQAWWMIYKDDLPELNEDEKKTIENITGCVPLLLRALLGLKGKDFAAILETLLDYPKLGEVTFQVEKFVKGKEAALTEVEWIE